MHYFASLFSVVLCADAVLEPSTKRSTAEIENLIVQNYISMSAQDLRSHLAQLLQVHGLELRGLQQSHSVRLYFGCTTVESLRELRKMFDSGQLRSISESFFSSLLISEPEVGPISLKLFSLVDYCKCEDFLARRTGKF